MTHDNIQKLLSSLNNVSYDLVCNSLTHLSDNEILKIPIAHKEVIDLANTYGNSHCVTIGGKDFYIYVISARMFRDAI